VRTSSAAFLPPLYINGLCEASHGFGDAGSFSLLSVRSDTIADEICNAIENEVIDKKVLASSSDSLRIETA